MRQAALSLTPRAHSHAAAQYRHVDPPRKFGLHPVDDRTHAVAPAAKRVMQVEKFGQSSGRGCDNHGAKIMDRRVARQSEDA